MTGLPGLPTAVLIPGVLGVYALAFLAGGIHYLEQRVARIRDQFPRRALLARLTGLAALGIGLLASISIGGYVLDRAPEYRLGALAATVAGVGFWVYRMHFDLSSANRVRNGLLALVCVALSVLTRLWIRVA
jgi:hypothetical protein